MKLAAMTTAILLCLSSAVAFGAGQDTIETTKSLHVKVRAVDHAAVHWTAGFWAERFELCRHTILPNMHRVMMLPNNSANFCNFQIAAGVRQGPFFGNDWGDGDCYKWIEAAAAVYDVTRDAELDRQMNELIPVNHRQQCHQMIGTNGIFTYGLGISFKFLTLMGRQRTGWPDKTQRKEAKTRTIAGELFGKCGLQGIDKAAAACLYCTHDCASCSIVDAYRCAGPFAVLPATSGRHGKPSPACLRPPARPSRPSPGNWACRPPRYPVR